MPNYAFDSPVINPHIFPLPIPHSHSPLPFPSSLYPLPSSLTHLI